MRPFSHRIRSIEMSSTSASVNAVAEMRRAGVDVIDFGPGEPHFATPEHIKNAAIKAIYDNKTKYTAVSGTAELRDAIVARHRRDFGSKYTAEEVIACPGGKYSLFIAMQILVDAGDEVIVPTPSWVSFKEMVHFAGGRCVFVDTTADDFRLTPEDIRRALTPRTKVMILNFPNNPSGAVMDGGTLERILEIAAQHDIWVLSDECYVYITFSGNPVSAGQFGEYSDNVVIVGSLSKTYAMTGWRVGYALGPSSVIQAMQCLQSQEVSCACSVSQAAGIAALTGSQDCIEHMRKDYSRLSDIAQEGLRGLPGIHTTRPGGAFYLFPDISEQLRLRNLQSANQWAQMLLEKHAVVVVPGEGFGSSHHVRLAYCVSEAALMRGLQKIRDFCSTGP